MDLFLDLGGGGVLRGGMGRSATWGFVEGIVFGVWGMGILVLAWTV